MTLPMESAHTHNLTEATYKTYESKHSGEVYKFVSDGITNVKVNKTLLRKHAQKSLL